MGSWTRQLARLEAEGGGTLLVGDLSAERDILDVRDVCRAYRLLLDPSVPAGTYNVSSGETVTMARVVELLVGLAGVPVEVERDESAHSSCRGPRASPATRRACAPRPDGEPEIPLEQTLADTLAARSASWRPVLVSDRRALITGVTGQDGSYLAELLLEKGYEVYGMTRRASTENVERIAHLVDRIDAAPGRPARPALARRSAPAGASRTRSTTWRRRASSRPRGTSRC